MSKLKTNILCQYQGGRYSGCHWEWNYFYIDKQGNFHNIESSGSAGIDNLRDAEQLIEQDKDSTYIYDISNEQNIETFCNESHSVHASGVLQWFNDYNANEAESFIDFFAVCSACKGQISDHDDLIIKDDLLLCWECFSIGECPCCDYYVGDTEIVKVEPKEHHGFDYICAACKECHDDEREAESLKDLRWQAFCTGKPDIFSDELRPLWVS